MSFKEKAEKINSLREKISQCKRCLLFKSRNNTVPGEGNVDSRIMFIGEAPGKNEDEQGKPFVGRAGDIFDKLLDSVNLTRDDIYLCNILKCRPPGNRNPLSAEIMACVGSLDIQIKTINPDIIATLGSFATTYIFEKFSIPKKNISSVAGKVIEVDTEFGWKKIIPLFHPAVATYNVNKTEDLINDFQVIRRALEVKPISEEQNGIIEEIHEQEDNISAQMEMWPQ